MDKKFSKEELRRYRKEFTELDCEMETEEVRSSYSGMCEMFEKYVLAEAEYNFSLGFRYGYQKGMEEMDKSITR